MARQAHDGRHARRREIKQRPLVVLLAAALAVLPTAARAYEGWKASLGAAAVGVGVGVLAILGQSSMEQFKARAIGDPVLPYLRVDQGYQHVGSAARGSSTRLQAGYGPVAAGFEYLHYWERGQASNRDYWQAEALVRLADSLSFRADVALGYRAEQRGVSVRKPQSGVSFGAYSAESGLGLEGDMRWADFHGKKVLGDGRVRGVYRIKKGAVSLFGGYRWLRLENGRRLGPETGITLTW